MLALRIAQDLATRSADTRPTTGREDDLSIVAVAATETPTRMRILKYDREYGGNRYQDFDEILDVAGLSDDEIRGFVGRLRRALA